jgi:NADH dehydrogenase
VDVVTGAFSFTGRYIAARLLESGHEVRTLTRRPQSESPFGDRVQAFPLDFADPGPLRGADTLYNTYWIRFPAGATSFEDAVARSEALFGAARAAGVRRIVQLSVTHASPRSQYAYFRGKAAVEAVLSASGISHAIVRPTLVFGEGEVLVNNIAWLLRRFPVFVLPRSACRLRPIAAEDLAAMCVEAAHGDENVTFDAAGPDEVTFEDVVRTVRAELGARSALVRAGRRTVLAFTRALGLLAHETLLTPEELGALADDLLTSGEPPRGAKPFAGWVRESAPTLGSRLATGDRRPWLK